MYQGQDTGFYEPCEVCGLDILYPYSREILLSTSHFYQYLFKDEALQDFKVKCISVETKQLYELVKTSLVKAIKQSDLSPFLDLT